MKLLGTRILLVFLAVPLVALTFVATLLREIGSAFLFAWSDARSEVESVRRAWREGFGP